MLSPKSMKALLWGGGAAVSVVFAWLALRNVNWTEAWQALQNCEWWWLLPTLACLAAATLLKVVRWQHLFEPRTRPAFAPALVALLVGLFFNAILPARAGEAARVVAINRDAGTSRGEAATTIVLERIFDLLALLAILFVALPWLPSVTWIHRAAILAIALAVGVLIAVVLVARYQERTLRLLLRPLRLLPFVPADRVEALVVNAHQGLAGIRNARLAATSATLTVASWLLLALSNWFLLQGFGLDLPFQAGLLVVVAVNLALVLPSSPAGLGVFEAATLAALHAYGIPDSSAISYALVLHAVNLIPYLAAGVFVVHAHTAGYSRSREATP